MSKKKWKELEVDRLGMDQSDPDDWDEGFDAGFDAAIKPGLLLEPTAVEAEQLRRAQLDKAGKQLDEIDYSKSDLKLVLKLTPKPVSKDLMEIALIRVNDRGSYNDAGLALRVLKGLEKTIKDHFQPMKQAAHKAHKTVTTAEKENLKPVEKATRELKARMQTWKGDEDARVRAKKLEEQKELATAREAYAKELEKVGDLQTAEVIRTTDPPVPEIAIKPTREPDGISTRRAWKWRLVSEKVTEMDRAYMVPDAKLIGQMVRDMGPEAAKMIGGIEVYQVETLVARS